MSNKVLMIGEPILDITIPVIIPEQSASVHGRAEPIVYEQQRSSWRVLGGVLYWARFLHPFLNDNLSVVLPLPNGGFRTENVKKLLGELATNIKINEIPLHRKLGEILRFVEMEKLSVENFSELPRSILRVDAGDRHRINENEVKEIEEKFRNEYQWLIKGAFSKYVVLADYNLGLFTRDLLKRINTIVSDDVNIIVYARRRWQKYAEVGYALNDTW